MIWQQLGFYEYEVGSQGYTGWYRCIGGRLVDKRWPNWNYNNGQTRFQ